MNTGSKKALSADILIRTVLILAFSLIVFVREVSAHSQLIASRPRNGDLMDQAPEVVTASFSEELDTSQSSIQVYDANDNMVDLGDGGVDLNDLDHKSLIVSLPPLPAGTYTVRWKSLSAEDGDSAEGAFAFTVEIGEGIAGSGQGSANGSAQIPWLAILIIIVVAMTAIILYFRQRGSQVAGR